MSALVIALGAQTRVFHTPFTAGQHGSGLTVLDEYASNHHAYFQPDGRGWEIRDLTTLNGTYVNGERLTGPHAIAKGDKIRIGRTVLTAVPTP